MEISEIIKGLHVCARGDGCQGCPLENHPEIPGNLCDGQLMREAADNLEKLNDFEHSQLAIVMAENAQLRAVITQNDPDFFTRKCRVCGCDWNHPCEGGCYWVSDDLCSKCADKEVKS